MGNSLITRRPLELILDGVVHQIPVDDQGRCLINELHKAIGGDSRKRPGYWRTSAAAKALEEAINAENPGIPAVVSVKGGNKGVVQGTFVHPELAISYAQWVSLDFHRAVNRMYLTVARDGAFVGDRWYNLHSLVCLFRSVNSGPYSTFRMENTPLEGHGKAFDTPEERAKGEGYEGTLNQIRRMGLGNVFLMDEHAWHLGKWCNSRFYFIRVDFVPYFLMIMFGVDTFGVDTGSRFATLVGEIGLTEVLRPLRRHTLKELHDPAYIKEVVDFARFAPLTEEEQLKADLDDDYDCPTGFVEHL